MRSSTALKLYIFQCAQSTSICRHCWMENGHLKHVQCQGHGTIKSTMLATCKSIPKQFVRGFKKSDYRDVFYFIHPLAAAFISMSCLCHPHCTVVF